eukprot:PhF_6_TR23964/c0_g1_i1/m.33539
MYSVVGLWGTYYGAASVASSLVSLAGRGKVFQEGIDGIQHYVDPSNGLLWLFVSNCVDCLQLSEADDKGMNPFDLIGDKTNRMCVLVSKLFLSSHVVVRITCEPVISLLDLSFFKAVRMHARKCEGISTQPSLAVVVTGSDGEVHGHYEAVLRSSMKRSRLLSSMMSLEQRVVFSWPRDTHELWGYLRKTTSQQLTHGPTPKVGRGKKQQSITLEKSRPVEVESHLARIATLLDNVELSEKCISLLRVLNPQIGEGLDEAGDECNTDTKQDETNVSSEDEEEEGAGDGVRSVAERVEECLCGCSVVRRWTEGHIPRASCCEETIEIDTSFSEDQVFSVVVLPSDVDMKMENAVALLEGVMVSVEYTLGVQRYSTPIPAHGMISLTGPKGGLLKRVCIKTEEPRAPSQLTTLHVFPRLTLHKDPTEGGVPEGKPHKEGKKNIFLW